MKRFYRVWYTILPALIGGTIGIALMAQQKEIYQIYQLPRWMPPQWSFGVVWTVLYLMLGYSLYLIWSAPRTNHTMLAASLLISQLAMNYVWCYVFFLFHQLLVAVLLHIAILMLGLWNYSILNQIDRNIGHWHIPYLLWLMFALYLSWSIYLFNL